ncbi:threonine aldolase family protein [Paenibacillus motobuensis]|uniref:Aminotransferase class I/II-fold pyridoxal phosphate-dependent enzyme n=1 Tax=Paenibacillus motobuensis TaxID=295324 RepID=A0ABP3IL11_9BACL
MTMNQTIGSAFNKTTYRLSGHGPRNIGMLMTTFHDMDENTDSDMYGKGKLIEQFQEKMAEFLGKESAVFFPSGTMAQQIALRIWCDRQGLRKVAYHPLCHLEIHEEDGLKKLHGIEPVLLADRSRLITLDDVKNMSEDISCLLLELPQREIGGQLPDYAELEAISAYCHEQGIKLHLDGARLFEILPYYGKTAAEICSLFDSVYVSFYKGIGGVAGAILAGDSEFTEESKPWKRRHGGDLISLYPYIISSDYYFEQRIGKMEQYYEGARQLAESFNRCPRTATVPEVPVSNMFHIHFAAPQAQVEQALIDLYEETGIGITSNLRAMDENSCYTEISVGDKYAELSSEQIKTVFSLLNRKLSLLDNL